MFHDTASAAELERAHNVDGKYTIGLMMREWAACDEDEDVVSMALTVLRRLIEKHGVQHRRWACCRCRRSRCSIAARASRAI